jgi:hypothetical protein
MEWTPILRVAKLLGRIVDAFNFDRSPGHGKAAKARQAAREIAQAPPHVSL